MSDIVRERMKGRVCPACKAMIYEGEFHQCYYEDPASKRKMISKKTIELAIKELQNTRDLFTVDWWHGWHKMIGSSRESHQKREEYQLAIRELEAELKERQE